MQGFRVLCHPSSGPKWAGMLLAFGTALFAFVDHARAQIEEGGDTSGGNIFHSVPRELRQAVNAAEKAASEGRFVDAVELLGDLLNENPDGTGGEESQDYFVPSSKNDGTRISLRAKVLAIIAALPPAGRDAYEQAYGITARKMLDEAVASADVNKIKIVSRRYFHTKAGYEATYLLGRWSLDEGSPLAAALHFQRLVDSPGGSARFEPEISLLLASAWVSAGDSDRAREVLVAWRTKFQPVTVKAGEREVKVFNSQENAVFWLTENFGVHPLTRSGTTNQWLVYGGNGSRTAVARGDLPLVYDDMQLRWKTQMLSDQRENDAIEKLAKAAIGEGRPDVPLIHALAVGDYIVVRTADRLIGIDFATGKCVWEYPWDRDESTDPAAVATKSGGVMATIQSPNEARIGRIQQRIWRDSPYGMVASDGRSVYLVHDLGYAPEGANQQMPFMFAPGGIRQRNPDFPMPYNRLVALDLKTEGQTIWEIGDENGLAEPKLAGAFFLGPPLPVGDQLYVLVELNQEIRLLGLDPKSGRQVWAQQLALMEMPIMNDSVRRLAGATPSFGDGVLVCPTSGGAVVGVDVSTRSLLWAHEYRKPLDPNQARFIGGGRVIVRSSQQNPGNGLGWTDGTPIISQGKVLITPVESDELICLNLLTGERLWAVPRGDGRFLAGVWRDCVVVVNKNSISTFNLLDGKPGGADDGKSAWSEPLALPAGENGGPSAAMPSGRGFFSGDYYFLPTTAGEILKIDLKGELKVDPAGDGKQLKRYGKIEAKTKTEKPLGNLICYRDEVISVDGEVLATYYQLAALRRRVADILREKPNDIWAQLRQAELQLHDGQRLEAIKTLRHAGTLAAANDPFRDELRGLLISSLLAELRANFAGSRQLAQEVAGLIDERHRSEYLRTMAGGYAGIGESDRALTTYLELIDLEFPRAQEGLEPGRPPMEHRGTTWDVRRDRAIQSEVRKLFASVKSEQRPLLDQRLQTRWESIRGSGDIGQLRDFVTTFAFHPLANRGRLELASRLMATGDLTEAEQWLAVPAAAEELATRAGARAMLAEIFKRAQRLDEAAVLYRELATVYADTATFDGRTGREVVAALPPAAPVAQLYAKPTAWSYGQVKVTDNMPASQQPVYGYRRNFPVQIRSRTGPQAEGMQLSFEQMNGPALAVTDGSGKPLFRLPLNHPSGQRPYANNYNFNHAYVRGHLVIGLIGMEVVAIDTLNPIDATEERLLWRSDVATYTGIVRAPARRASAQSRDNLLGIPRSIAFDFSGTQIGTLGPLLETGVCYQRGRELVCVDPLSGETLWSRNDFAPGCELFGDNEAIVVAPPESTTGEVAGDLVECVVLDPLDGSEIGRCKLPNFGRRLGFCGRRVLTCKQTNLDYTIELLDPLRNGEAAWSLTAAAGTKGALLGEEMLGLMEPSGRFRAVNLADGIARIDAGLTPELVGISDIQLLRNESQYLLIVNTPPPAVDGSVTIRALPGGPQTVMVHGRVYAFDRKTGSQLWHSPAFIDQYGLPLDQPADLPVLVFMRYVEIRPAGRATMQNAQLLFIDRRDGRIRYEKNDLQQNALTTYTLIGEVAQNKVTLELNGNRRLVMQFTDEPTAPEPPAQTGKASSFSLANWGVQPSDGLFGSFGFGTPGSDPAPPMIELDRRRAFRPPLPALPAPEIPLIDPFAPRLPLPLPPPAPRPGGDPFAPPR